MDYVEFKLLYGALKAIALNFPSTHRAITFHKKIKKDDMSTSLVWFKQELRYR